MSTVAELITSLNTQKDALAANLVTKGVAAKDTEGFSTLVPKVLEIQGGGGGSEPCIITGTLLAGCSGEPTTSIPVVPHNDWDKIKNLIDYENAFYLINMFQYRKDLKIREVEEFLSHSMPNVVNLSSLALGTNFIDSDIATHVFDLTLNAPKCTVFNQMFRNSNIAHAKLTIPEHDADKTFSLGYAYYQCRLLNDLEIKGPGLSQLNNLQSLCEYDAYLQTVTIGDDDTNYSKVSRTNNMFNGCSNLKTLTIKGVSVLPLTAGNIIPTTIESIKVPAALVDSYKTATNWVVYADKISAI